MFRRYMSTYGIDETELSKAQTYACCQLDHALNIEGGIYRGPLTVFTVIL